MTTEDAFILMQAGVGLTLIVLGVSSLILLGALIRLWLQRNPPWLPPAPFEAPDRVWITREGGVHIRINKSGTPAVEYRRTGNTYTPAPETKTGCGWCNYVVTNPCKSEGQAEQCENY